MSHLENNVLPLRWCRCVLPEVSGPGWLLLSPSSESRPVLGQEGVRGGAGVWRSPGWASVPTLLSVVALAGPRACSGLISKTKAAAVQSSW